MLFIDKALDGHSGLAVRDPQKVEVVTVLLFRLYSKWKMMV